jgi:hypothetical protein
MSFFYRLGKIIARARRVLRSPTQSAAPGFTCEDVVGLIADYLSGVMDRDTTAAFEAHLRRCADCIAFLSTYKHTITAVWALQVEELPAEMEGRVRHFLEIRARRSGDDRRPPA